jgi:hypothetical protein
MSATVKTMVLILLSLALALSIWNMLYQLAYFITSTNSGFDYIHLGDKEKHCNNGMSAANN